MRFFAALSCLAVSAMSQALLLDNFTVPYSKTINSGSWVEFQTDPTLYTGERDVEVLRLSGGSSPISVDVGQGELSISVASGAGGVKLEYDGVGDEVNNTGAGKSLIHNPNLGNSFPEGTRIVRFHVLSVDATATLGAQLVQNGTPTFSNSRNPTIGGAQIVDVPFHPSAFQQCDSLFLQIGTSSGRLVLSHVELVPEPSPAILLGAAATLLLRKRQRKSDGVVSE